MKLLLFLLLFVGLSTLSCEKGAGNFVLKGKVTDITFATGFEGAEIKLYKVPIGTTSELLVESKTLGADGRYNFSFPREKIEKYVIRVSKPNYFPIEETIFYSSLSIAEDNVRDFSTGAKSWVKLRIINNGPVSTDHLRYIKQAGLQGCTECCPNSEQNYYGALDTSIYCINDGNSIYSIYYWIIGTNMQGLKEVTTIPFDTTQILLTY